MSPCLTATALRGLATEAPSQPPAPAQQQHLLACATCRAALLQAFRAHAHLTLPDHASLDDTAPSGESRDPELAPVPARQERYGLRSGADAQPEVLGRGGYGKVLLARDLSVGRDVALKCLRSKVTQSPHRAQAEARLLREARIVGQLEHPAIVALYDIGRTAEGQLFYTMRRVRGRTLAEAVRSAPELTERLRLLPHVLAACHALAYAHSRGVIHRDLKPQNVMIDRFGQTAVIDWGLAAMRGVTDEPSEPGDSGALRLVGEGETLSDGRGRLGTPAYMSPEQLTGVRSLMDERSDVWGLGAILYEVLTGQSPRESGPLTNRPRPVRELEPGCPADLATLCEKALAEQRSERYESAEALAADLDAWLHGRQVAAHVYRPTELLRRFVAEQKVPLLVALVSLAAVLTTSVVSYVRLRDERNRAREFGLAMLGDVLPRLSSLGDTTFLERFTSRVQTWLESAGTGDDAPAVGHAWFGLALHANGGGKVADTVHFSERCLAMLPHVKDPAERYALEQGCAVLLSERRQTSQDVRNATSEALWSQPLPRGAEQHPWAVQARQLVANVRLFAANERLDPRARDLAAATLELARRRRQLSPEDPTARASLTETLLDAAYAQARWKNQAQAGALVREAAAEARELVTTSPSMRSLMALCDVQIVAVTQRWPGAVEPGTEDEARVACEAVQLLAPASEWAAASLMQLYLTVGPREALRRAADRAAKMVLYEDSRAGLFYAFLATDRSAEVLARRAWLAQEPVTFDTRLAFALAAADLGELAEAARILRQLEANLEATIWVRGAFLEWAAQRRGPAAPALQRFVQAMETANTPQTEAALGELAGALEQLGAAPKP